MFDHYTWQSANQEQAEPFLKLINPIQSKFTAGVGTATVQWAQLPFYNSTNLVRVNDSTWPDNAGPFWFLAKHGRTFLLDGSSAPIHDANEADAVTVTEGKVLDYLEFFCYFVHGEEGPFLIVRDISHPAIDQSKIDGATREVIENALRPPAFEGKADDGRFEASAMVLYGNALFSARFSLSADGMVEMIDDEPIATDLPVRKVKPGY